MPDVSGFLWRKYCVAIPAGRPGYPVVVPANTRGMYPGLMRWDQMEAAVLGVVLPREDLLPQAICYDMDRALLVLSGILGRSGSRVIDVMDVAEFFCRNLLGAYAGGDTPFFWSPDDNWDDILVRFNHNIR